MVLSVCALAALLAVQPVTAQTTKTRTTARPRTGAANTSIAVNLNTATAAEFEALPGVGPKMAARIVEYRQKNGPFKKIEELMNVQGIGEKNFLKLKPQLTVGAKGDVSGQQ
jgi:competence protein ComEA